MSVFELVKQNVSMCDAAQQYGLIVGRGKRTLCPFHNDHHPSMALYDDHYHCFACGAHGDVIDLVGGLYQLSPYDAAMKLVADFNLDPQLASGASAVSCKSLAEERRRKQADANMCFNTMSDYLWVLRDWEKRYAPSSYDADWDEHYLEACRQLPFVEYLIDCWLEGDDREREDILHSDSFKKIQIRLAQIRLEEDADAGSTALVG